MHAAVCLLRAGQPRSAGDAAKSGQFIGQFSWVTGNPIVLKGLHCSRKGIVCGEWNRLGDGIVSAGTVNVFKMRLDHHLRNVRGFHKHLLFSPANGNNTTGRSRSKTILFLL